jgi:nucleoside-diphosphate-sugar epimerase
MILISGASGFLGSYITKILNNQNIEYLVLSRNKYISHNKTCNYIYFNIESDSLTSKLNILNKYNLDSFLHLAWNNLDDFSSINHLEQVENHFQLIKYVINKGVKNIFVAGTCLEYGNEGGPFDEKSVPNPFTNYAVAKNNLRIKLEQLQKRINFNLIWFRIFYIYGKGQRETSLFSSLENAIQRNEKTFTLTTSDNIYDFIDVSDAAQMIMQLLKIKNNLGIINICSGKGTKVINLANDIKKLFNSDIKFIIKTKASDNINTNISMIGSCNKYRTIIS